MATWMDAAERSNGFLQLTVTKDMIDGQFINRAWSVYRPSHYFHDGRNAGTNAGHYADARWNRAANADSSSYHDAGALSGASRQHGSCEADRGLPCRR